MTHTSRKNRRLTQIDFIIIAVLLGFFGYVFYRLDTVLNYQWHWQFLSGYFFRWDEQSGQWVSNLLIKSLLITLRLAFWSMLLAAFIGVILGICRTSQRLFFRLSARVYIELVRNIPPLVFIFIFYFFLSSQLMPLLGITDWHYTASPESLKIVTLLFGDPKLLENFISGAICLALFEAAYIAEIVRAGIQAVPQAQTEAGKSIGLTRLQINRYIVLPQALQKMLPPLASQFIMLIKDSSIVSLISVQELTFIGSEISVTSGRVFETWLTVAALYFLICFCLALIFKRLENRQTS